jgi:hypothetical protein
VSFVSKSCVTSGARQRRSSFAAGSVCAVTMKTQDWVCSIFFACGGLLTYLYFTATAIVVLQLFWLGHLMSFTRQHQTKHTCARRNPRHHTRSTKQSAQCLHQEKHLFCATERRAHNLTNNSLCNRIRPARPILNLQHPHDIV